MSPPQDNWFIGCMSGTSMDGVDIAEIRTDGKRIFEFGQTTRQGFTSEEIKILHLARGKWPGEGEVKQAARIVEETHLALLRANQRDAIVGFHGQTLAHDPGNQKTHQAGDGQSLADQLGKTVVWDFRSEDLINGGEGAPLAPFYHFALAKYLGLTKVCAFINIGGITNISIIDPQREEPENEGALAAFDIGPGNCLIDRFCQQQRNLPFDQDGQFAAKGQVDEDLVSEFLAHDFLKLQGPRSFDIHDFYFLLQKVEQFSFADGVATLTEFTARSIASIIGQIEPNPSNIVLCGGGTNNTYLVRRLKELTAIDIRSAKDWGLEPQYLEAQAFGFLAARVLRQLPTSAPGTTGCNFPTGGGRISYPSEIRT